MFQLRHLGFAILWQMTKIWVKNYKSIKDSDWINCSNITVFVGKNESGKSCAANEIPD